MSTRTRVRSEAPRFCQKCGLPFTGSRKWFPYMTRGTQIWICESCLQDVGPPTEFTLEDVYALGREGDS